MSIVQNQLCDNCGAVLNGKDPRNLRVRQIKNCIEIKGQVVAQIIDPESGWREHTFISPSKDADLAFCYPKLGDMTCFTEYVEKQIQRWKDHRTRELREQAGGEQIDRLSSGFTGTYKAPRQSPPPSTPPPYRPTGS